MLATRRRVRLKAIVNFRTHAFRLAASVVLALVAFALFLLADASGSVPALLSPLHAVAVHSQFRATPTDTTTPSATSTVAAAPPSITLVSPASGSGPVGAHVTIHGSNFTGSSAVLFGSSQSSCTPSLGTLATVDTSGGSVSKTFIWPVSFAVGTYYICTDGMTASTASFQVLTSLPPTLSLSALSVDIGQALTIQGRNFAGLAAGAAVSLTESASPGGGSESPQTLSANGVVDSNGAFSVTWTVQGPETGPVTITAYAGFEGSSPAVLQASASLTIQPAATATATIAPSPTAVATTAPVGGATSPSPPSSANTTNAMGLIILLVAGIIISMLVILGIVVYLILRRRTPENGGGQNPSYQGNNSYGSYDDPTIHLPSPQWGPSATLSSTGQYAWPQASGLVSKWEDPDELPGPDWQPRPMSGYYPEYGGSAFDRSTRPQAPADPWRDQQGRYDSYPAEDQSWQDEGAPHPDDDQWPDLGGDTWG